MKRKLGNAKSYLFEGNFIIGFEEEWLKFCKGSLEFSIEIDHRGRLILLGPVIETQNATSASGGVN